MNKQKIIIKNLVENKIDFTTAFNKIKDLPKVWHTKEWKDKRNKIIKNYCEKCKDNNSTFVLQHTKQPRKFYDILNYIREREKSKIVNKYKTNSNNIIDVEFSKIYNERKEELNRLALIESYSDHIEYISFTYTKTLCKKCAYKEDLLNIIPKSRGNLRDKYFNDFVKNKTNG